jgi:hypothetical protein
MLMIAVRTFGVDGSHAVRMTALNTASQFIPSGVALTLMILTLGATPTLRPPRIEATPVP